MIPVAPGAGARPYVVRFGPWARNLYLGLPAMVAFGLIPIAARMPWWLASLWYAFVAMFVVICAFPREVRVTPDRIVFVWRFLALVPVWRRTFPMSAFESIRDVSVSHAMSGEGTHGVHTVSLVRKTGRDLAVQSYSSGADNRPPHGELVRTLCAITRLPLVRA
jgi:hypothetical protein